MKKYSDQDSTGQCQVHVVVDLLRIFWRSILKKKYSEENIFLRNILTRTAVDSVRSTWSSGPPENFPPNWINAESETFSIRASKHFSQQVQFSKSFLLKVFWTVSIFFALIFEIKKWIVNENWHPNVYKGVGLKITWICFLCSPHFLLKLKIDFLQLKGWMTLFRK